MENDIVFQLSDDSSSSSSSINKSREFPEGEKDKEFYEEIEAPKFVDFTVPDHYRPDDRYWFCLRVGCDQKHEEDMDSEAIYKKFVLRVMAARSPNVRLHKTLNRNPPGKNMECPLSAPPKSAKSRLPRLAIVSMSQKMDKEKIRLLSKVSSTPKTKGKQVAAKYLTTPRNKKIPTNPNSFLSVQNPKPSSVAAVPKHRSVAKALVFHSPKKAISLKSSVETPLTKLCKGMKKLEITSQRKRVLGYSSKPSKPLGEDSQKSLHLHSSARQKDPDKEKSKVKTSHQQNSKSLRSEQCKSKGNLSSKEYSLKEIAETTKKPGQTYYAVLEVDSTSTEASKGELDSLKQSAQISIERNYTPRVQAIEKEEDSIEENGLANRKGSSENEDVSNAPMNKFEPSEGGQTCESQMTERDDKENASAFDEDRNIDGNIQTGKETFGMKNNEKKVAQAVVKNSKGSANIASTGTKLKKPKPTNPKPFRLRTDERGILREANLERKFHTVTSQKEAAPSTKFHTGNEKGHHCDIQKGSSKKEAVKTPKGKSRKITATTPKVLRHLTSTLESETCQDLENNGSMKTKSPHRMKKASQVIQQGEEEDSKHLEAQTPSKNEIKRAVGTRTPSGSKTSSKGRRPIITIPKEPNFHTPHIPENCVKKVA